MNLGLLDKWLDCYEKELVEDIRKLVRIPSVAGSEEDDCPYGRMCKKAADCMIDIAESHDLTATSFENRCVIVEYGEGRETVEIWGHLDVVAEGSGWIYPPYECIREGDFLIGRGVSDNKGAVVAVLYALRFLKESGINLKFKVRQVSGLCEEAGMNDIKHYQRHYGQPNYAFVSDCRFPLCYGEKGRCVITLESPLLEPDLIQAFHAGEADNSVPGHAYAIICGENVAADGVAGHAAAPEKCKNPIGILADNVIKIMERREDKDSINLISSMNFLSKTCSEGYGSGFGIDCEMPEFGKLTCQGTVARLEGRRILVTFDIRYPANMDDGQMMSKIKKEAEQYCFKVKLKKQHRGYLRNVEHPWIQLLLNSYRIVTGDLSEPYVIGGNTYASYLGEFAVPFGPVIHKDYSLLKLPPGHGGGHGADEVQSVSSLRTAVKVYVHALISWSEQR